MFLMEYLSTLLGPGSGSHLPLMSSLSSFSGSAGSFCSAINPVEITSILIKRSLKFTSSCHLSCCLTSWKRSLIACPFLPSPHSLTLGNPALPALTLHSGGPVLTEQVSGLCPILIPLGTVYYLLLEALPAPTSRNCLLRFVSYCSNCLLVPWVVSFAFWLKSFSKYLLSIFFFSFFGN